MYVGEIEVDPGAGRPKLTLTAHQQIIVPKSGIVGLMTNVDANNLLRWWEK